VIEAIQGPLRLNRCVLAGACPRQGTCTIRAKIGVLQEQMDDYLRSVSLADLVQERGADGKGSRAKCRRRQK
jgi:DNA-binding IscR family transcriptional regulator